MPTSSELVWQPSLLSAEEAMDFDRSFSSLERIHLDETSWVDHCPGWVSGADQMFDEVLASRPWSQRSRKMYDKEVLEPRLTAPWNAKSGKPLEPLILDEIRLALSERYERTFDSLGFNLYRGGDDSVAWHGDRIPKEVVDPVVALLSLGEPRKFLLRPKKGGTGERQTFLLGRGDLLVTGGQTQRTWDHSVPKVKEAGPRISIAFRHDMSREPYEEEAAAEGASEASA